MADEPEEPKPTILLPLYGDEANNFMELLDLACRHGGLQVAPFAAELARRVQARAREAEPTQAVKG